MRPAATRAAHSQLVDTARVRHVVQFRDNDGTVAYRHQFRRHATVGTATLINRF